MESNQVLFEIERDPSEEMLGKDGDICIFYLILEDLTAEE